MDRQTGRTTKQMIEAPRDSLFVWCNTHIHYPRCLARALERTDLRILSPGMLDFSTLCSARSRGGKLVVDHACQFNDRLWQWWDYARAAGMLV